MQRSNWTSADRPCAKYDDLRNPVLGNIGVKIDVSDAWAVAFRRAFRFWNTVLAADFHEESSLSACAIRVINGGADILNHSIVARSQITEWTDFRGKIAVRAGAAEQISSGEMYGVAVHELGHMLGLKHNESSQSFMYFLDINGTEGLDGKDIVGLSKHHKLRSTSVSIGLLPVEPAQLIR